MTVLPPVLLVVLGLNWGFGFVLSKLGVTNGLMPLGYAFWQCLGGGLMLLAIARWRGETPPLAPRHLRYYVISGIANIAVPNTVALFSLRYIPAGIMVLLVTLTPLMTYGLSLALRLESFHARRALGMMMGFAGAMLILIPRASLPSAEMSFWATIAVLVPVFYAASNVYVGWARPADVPSIALGAAMQTTAGLALLPGALLLDQFHVLWPPLGMGEIANLTHIAVAGFGALLFFEIIRMAGPVYLSQVGYVVCLSGVFWGWLVFDERHSVWVWAAMALIFAGVTLVTAPGRR